MKNPFLILCCLLLSTIVFSQNVIVETENGKIEGEFKDDLNYFLGVPYAQPPLNSLRWHKPVELDEWEGIKETKKFAPSAMQTNVFGDMIYRSDGKSEDCLYLNIWSPEIDEDKKLPVLVYFYGGGFVAGDGSEPRYDGSTLAKQGIVTVTVNYRLNIFGFFAHPELSKEADYNASGNYGLLDQSAALKWVYENIENFGGDPDKITIAGESAGSISVSAQMASPLSKEFLAGAIGESGSSINPTLAPVSLTEAEKIGVDFLNEAGYSFSEFRNLPSDTIYKIYQESGRFGFPTVIDNYFLPKTLPEIFRDKEQAQIPLLVGWNSAEVSAEALMQDNVMNLKNYRSKLDELYPENSEKVFQLYKPESEDEVRMMAAELASDRFISYSTWKWADLHANNSEKPVFRYLFSRIRPSDPNSSYKPVGAAHASEIEYFLGNLSKDQFPYLTETDFEISKTIQQYLLNFIKTGDPNGNGLVDWPSVEPNDKNPPVLIMDEDFKVKNSEIEKRYQFLDVSYGNN
ncbi:carboxylesterase/lipase family protein [Christiangramia sp. SM2212]|uniref:Carboxylic ester hydrolase n=1 Tax=Christiangramia sediminicola TaxID=3073267 RepID=A0ABU1ELD3_9FLAO|nr:carboxylesterase family protein [Christiangramia sp. SM2212]MDR5589182.1 carboxylesterase family protein [Christiangramia sp. SM2212]